MKLNLKKIGRGRRYHKDSLKIKIGLAKTHFKIGQNSIVYTRMETMAAEKAKKRGGNTF